MQEPPQEDLAKAVGRTVGVRSTGIAGRELSQAYRDAAQVRLRPGERFQGPQQVGVKGSPANYAVRAILEQLWQRRISSYEVGLDTLEKQIGVSLRYGDQVAS